MFRAASDANPNMTILTVDGVGAYDHVLRSAMLGRLHSAVIVSVDRCRRRGTVEGRLKPQRWHNPCSCEGRRRLLKNTDYIVYTASFLTLGQVNPSARDACTQTRTMMIVRLYGRSKGDDGQKRPIFKCGVQTQEKVGGQKWGKMQCGVRACNKNTRCVSLVPPFKNEGVV